jgi:hypothetical protein
MTDNDLAEMDRQIQATGARNCWTGTSGSMAAIARRLVNFLREGRAMPGTTSAAVQLLEQARAAVIDRHGKYGPPVEHFGRTVGMVNAAFAGILTRPLTPSDWALIMTLDKVSRHMGPARTTDTPIDLAGYAACLAECEAVSQGASSPPVSPQPSAVGT